MIDDDRNLPDILSIKLAKLDLSIIAAYDGERGIELIKENQFDLTLLDMRLPGISGIEVLKTIRTQLDPFQLPILMLTSNEKSALIIESLNSGANDFISKMAPWEVKLARIETQLALKDLYNKGLRTKELETLNSLIITYNHEINNPLSVAFTGIELIEKKENLTNNEYLRKVHNSLERIRDVLKKIEKVSETSEIEYEEYTSSSNMVKI